jgi:ribosomal protein S18 acetylase RimI-like enzyme
MHLRRLEPPDAPLYRAFRLRGLHDHPEAFTSSFEEESQRPLADTERRLSSDSRTCMWGAFEGEQLIGVFGFERENRLKNSHKATLIGLFVAPELAGRGIGRALVETVMHGARDDGIALLVLTVTEGNTKARALYTRAGFQTIGIEPDAIRVAGASFGKEHLFFQLTPPLQSSVPTSLPSNRAAASAAA